MREVHSSRPADPRQISPPSFDQPGEVNPESSPISVSSPAPRQGTIARGRSVLRILSSFFLGQGALQAIQVVTGFLLVRWLSVEAWAQYGVALGLQLTMTSLMDLGVSGTIIPLVGERRDDRRLVGRYARSALHLRNRTFWLLAPVTAGIFFAITWRHHWNWHVEVLLLASVFLALYSSGHVSCFSPPFFLFGCLREFYLPQTFSGALRLIVYAACRLARVLNAWLAAGVYALTTALNGILLERKSRSLMEWPDEDDPQIDREVLHYIVPAIPAVIFSAFQAQISLFLITIFGSTANVAQVAALGKLGQLFSVLMTFNVVVVEPFMARLDRRRLLPAYLRFVALAALCCVPLVLLAFTFPRLFLWLLGSNYSGLSDLVGWVIAAACINFLAGLMWIMNRARKWLFWSGTALEIVLLLGVQIGYILLFGVTTTRAAVFFTFASSWCYLATHFYVAIVGFWRGPRKTLSSQSAGS